MNREHIEALQLGIQQAKTGQNALAKLQLEKAVQLEPTCPHTWFWLSWTAESLEQSLSYIGTATSITADHPLINAYKTVLEVLQKYELPPELTIDLEQEEDSANESESCQSHESSHGTTLLHDIDLNISYEDGTPGTGSQSHSPDEETTDAPNADANADTDADADVPENTVGPATEEDTDGFVVNLSADESQSTTNHIPAVEPTSSVPTNSSDTVDWLPADEEQPHSAELPRPSSTDEFSEPNVTEYTPHQEAEEAIDLVSEAPLILGVDDSPTVRKLVQLTLQAEGYRVETAEDAIDAIHMLKELQPALILLDINMPRMDGYKLCKLLKGQPKTRHIPVLMLSGKDGVFDKLRGSMAGCNGYIVKPFEARDLITWVGLLIESTATVTA